MTPTPAIHVPAPKVDTTVIFKGMYASFEGIAHALPIWYIPPWFWFSLLAFIFFIAIIFVYWNFIR